MLFWNIRLDARASSWQGTGATLVALIAATRLPSLLRISETKHYFLSLDTIVKMAALRSRHKRAPKLLVHLKCAKNVGICTLAQQLSQRKGNAQAAEALVPDPLAHL